MPNSFPPGFESLENVHLEILDLDSPSSCYVDISSIVTDKITLEHCSNTQILSLVNKHIYMMVSIIHLIYCNVRVTFWNLVCNVIINLYKSSARFLKIIADSHYVSDLAC